MTECGWQEESENMTQKDGFLFDPDKFPRLGVEKRRTGVSISLLATELNDESILKEVEDQVVEFVKVHTPKRVVIDFGSVRFMSSMMLRSLIRIRDWVIGNNGQLRLAAISPSIREVFRITQLEGRLFLIHDTVDEAFDAFF
jgi:anti-anti-sigma factor